MLAFDSFGYSAKLVPSEYIGFSIVSMVIIYMGFIFSIYWCKISVPWDDWCIWFYWDCLICVFTGKFLPSSVDILCCSKHFYWGSLHPVKWWYPIVYMSQSLGHTNSSHSCHCCGGYATWQGIYVNEIEFKFAIQGWCKYLCVHHIGKVAYEYLCINRSGIYSYCM